MLIYFYYFSQSFSRRIIIQTMMCSLVVIYYCIKVLLQIQWLKNPHIHYLSDSVSQESGQSLTGPSAQGLLQSTVMGWPALNLISSSKGNICFHTSVSVGKIQFPAAFGLKILVSFGLLVKATVWPFPQGSPQHGSLLLKSARKRVYQQDRCYNFKYYNHRTTVVPSYLLDSFGQGLQIPPALEGRNDIRI